MKLFKYTLCYVHGYFIPKYIRYVLMIIVPDAQIYFTTVL